MWWPGREIEGATREEDGGSGDTGGGGRWRRERKGIGG